MWLVGKKFEKTIGVSFNTINHLCWNILHNQSFSFPCRYFSSLTWYKMYMLFVAPESYFPHAVVERLRAWPITAPFGLGCRFLPSSGALNSPVRTWPPGELPGGEEAASFMSSSGMRPWEYGAMKFISQHGRVLCLQRRNTGFASLPNLLYPPAKQTYVTASDPCRLPAGCLMASAKWVVAVSQIHNSKHSPC